MGCPLNGFKNPLAPLKYTRRMVIVEKVVLIKDLSLESLLVTIKYDVKCVYIDFCIACDSSVC